MYYVYALLDTRKPGKHKYGRYVFDYEPFYIGKGKGRRCHKHFESASTSDDSFKNRVINKIVQQTGSLPDLVIKKDNMAEADAFALEIKLIKLIGRRDKKLGPLVNLTDGGDGTSGKSEESLAKFRKSIAKRYADPEYKANNSKKLREANLEFWNGLSDKDRKAIGRKQTAHIPRTKEELDPVMLQKRNGSILKYFKSDKFNSRHHACLVGLGRLLDRFFYGKYKKLRPEFEQLTKKRIARKFQSKPNSTWKKLRRLVVRDIEQLFGHAINHKDSSFRDREQERLTKNKDIGNSVSASWQDMSLVEKALRKACIGMGMWVSKHVAEPDRAHVKSVLRDRLEKLISTGAETWKDLKEKVLVGVARATLELW